MEHIKIDKWEQFETELENIVEERYQRKKKTPFYVSNLLFRGQSNSSWPLETTLERYILKPFKVSDYFRRIHAAKPQIETHTGHVWDIMTPSEFEQWVKEQEAVGLDNMPGYDYMVYLRHHGFPSPLLDWSQSPYIAAFFAFTHASTRAAHVSIYAFLEHAGYGKFGRIDAPRISVRGPYVRSHRRHFLQQSEYTICPLLSDQEWVYASHEKALAQGNERQNLLWKFDIPSSERVRVLRLLDQYNLNAFSLFASEESLMETLSVRELLFHDQNL